MRELDRALVRAAGMLDSARHVLQAEAGPPGSHPPRASAPRSSPACSPSATTTPAAATGSSCAQGTSPPAPRPPTRFAKLLQLSSWIAPSARERADNFDLPGLTDWQRRILARAVSFVGFPYVWGGTSERTQTLFGVTSRGGFDCSGLRLEDLPAGVLLRRAPAPQRAARTHGLRDGRRGAGVGTHRRRSSLRPGDLVFFSERGTEARPADVSHMGIYAGGGWFVHSSSQGTTMTTLSGWYADRFAWGRRPLREAGLT